MVTDDLRHALAHMNQVLDRLPEETQQRIAAIIEEELEQQEWDALVSSPRSREFLHRLIAEAEAEDTAGESEDGGWEP
jgi:hypothetical protein